MQALLKQYHSLTVDVEDWYHICGVTPQAQILQASRVVEATARLLAIMRNGGVTGTFFMLGEVAESHPELTEMIAADGHELASHGWSHRLVTELAPAEFQDELERTSEMLEQQTGKKPVGFRAPQWSLCRHKTPWAFEILAKLGFKYDSSLTPLRFIGDPNGLVAPNIVETAHGRLWEIPPMVTPSLLGNLPTGGGWGFRFFPCGMIETTMLRYQHMGLPAVLFVHPRELDPDGPRMELSRAASFVAYGQRKSSAARLERLMKQFSFRPLGELVETWQSAS